MGALMARIGDIPDEAIEKIMGENMFELMGV